MIVDIIATVDGKTFSSPVQADRGAFIVFKVGDLVRKHSGYEYPGVVVAVFTTRAGQVRYVVEADHPSFSGMLHIFAEKQLELFARAEGGQRLSGD